MGTPKQLYLDTESFSELPLKKVGAYKYAEAVETIIVSWAWNDEAVTVWDCTYPTPESGAAWLRTALQDMINAADEVLMHNGASFDRTTLAAQGVTIPVEKIKDTMVLALQHSLPASLDMLCDVLDVPRDLAKDKEGKKLIQLFCKPRPKNVKLRRATRETHPAEWQAFLEYARLDIEAMREVYKRIPRWNDTASERELWLLDQQAADAGIAVDLDLAQAALRAFERTSQRLAREAIEATNGAVGSATQRARLKDYLEAEHGFDIADMTKGSVEKALKDEGLHPEVRALLENRQQAAATSPAKYQVFIDAAGSDGRLRGIVQFCGAARTGRDAGRLVQLQNLPRPSMPHGRIEAGIAAMKADCEDLLFDNVSELCVNAVRGTLVAADGKKLCVSDLSNIEGRVAAWLAGEEWKIQAFKDFDAGVGPDLYKVAAGRILGKPPEAVTKDERQLPGKVSELACQFGGALGAFGTMAALYGFKLPDDEIITIVKAWRAAHPRIKSMWYALEDAMRAVIASPGTSVVVRKLTVDSRYDAYENLWMRIRLPSGRYLCYLRPEINRYVCTRCCGDGVVPFVFEGVERRLQCPDCGGTGQVGNGEVTYEGIDQYTRQWKKLKTYGGKCFENGVQAAARDVFMAGFRRAMKAGYFVVLRVHDELGAEVPDDPAYSADGLSGLMTTHDQWMIGLPLAAAGDEMYIYHKA